MLLALGASLADLLPAAESEALAQGAVVPDAPFSLTLAGLRLHVRGFTVRHRHDMLDVTCMNDESPRYVPGLRRSTFEIEAFPEGDRTSCDYGTLQDFMQNGGLLQFDEAIGSQRVRAQLQVHDFAVTAGIDSIMEIKITAEAVGPVIVEPHAAGPAVVEPTPVPAGRRGMAL
jgi:hypothetical protein